MNIKEWCIKNGTDFSKINSEEDVKIKVLLPFLSYIGYNKNDFIFENSINVQIGTKKTKVRSDIEIQSDGKTQIVIDAKAPSEHITERDILQVTSYAKLISTPPASLAVVTNGTELINVNVITGEESDIFLGYKEFQALLNRQRKIEITDEELKEIKKVLITLRDREELNLILKKCKKVIESQEGIRTDLSFMEISKILIVKMAEERRVKNKRSNRFSKEYTEREARRLKISSIEIFNKLFEEAKQTYNIFDESYSKVEIKIKHDNSILKIVELLEPWSFLGTGEDIKGSVYEIFLKATLRGELGQFFTPRELVDFMVDLTNPQIGDIILDPACGSGGFLIKSFLKVNRDLLKEKLSEKDHRIKFLDLINKCLWGLEVDPDLHILAKINLVMHGDGYNNIYNVNTITCSKEEDGVDIPENSFDLILTNPPFSFSFEDKKYLSKYMLGVGKQSEQIDILFLEKCMRLLKEGKDVAIVLPEGLLNLPKFQYLRDFLLDESYLIVNISIPGGAFVPFGQSNAKTCILVLRKKLKNKPKYCFFADAVEIGYKCGKKEYKRYNRNDLNDFLKHYFEVSKDVKTTEWGGRSVWIEYEELEKKRLDAKYYLMKRYVKGLKKSGAQLRRLGDVATVTQPKITPSANSEKEYFYLEVPDITNYTGMISNIRRIKGKYINGQRVLFKKGDILFTRIYPDRMRIIMVPDEIESGVCSGEIYIIYPKNKDELNPYALLMTLKSSIVMNQVKDRISGTSTSRPRISDRHLREVLIPVLSKDNQIEIARLSRKSIEDYWISSQNYLRSTKKIMGYLGDDLNINLIRSV